MHIEHSDFHDQLVRGLTHKMNNILSLFHGYLGMLLEDKKLDSSTLSGLERIKESASAASELMDRMKSLARPSSVIWRQINLREFLESIKPFFEAELARGVVLQVSAPDDVSSVWADTSRLKTVLVEIVRNAIEASPPKGVVTIEASTESPTTNGGAGFSSAAQPINWMSITITDRGRGIPKEITDKIYQPFFSTKYRQNAMGLGLTVALGLTQQMGGVIRITSEPGCTAVRIMLPSRSERF